MRRWRAFGVAAGIGTVSVLVLGALLQFLAPSVSYQLEDRVAESFSGRGNRPFRIALGTRAGSYYYVGEVLNRYLKEKAGYELELVATAGVPENVGALLDPARGIDLATIESSSDEAAKAKGLAGLAAVGEQHFFVIVPNDSPVREFRDLTGAVNPGVREAGQAPTLGERVLEYYGLVASPSAAAGQAAAVSIVRPGPGSIAGAFDAGGMRAATRTQFLHAALIENVLGSGRFRLVPVRDHEALAGSLPGTRPGFIPAGLYGPGRRIPSEPVPTLTVASLLVARSDLPGRVARDILEVVYDPRFARDIQFTLTEESGQKVGDLPLHPAAEIFYHRNDLVTSDLVGRLSFVATLIGALFAASQFVSRVRGLERRKARHRLLSADLGTLKSIRQRIEDGVDQNEARQLIAQADDVLYNAEQDAAAGLLDAEGIQSLRSVHAVCWRAIEHTPATKPSPEAAIDRASPTPQAQDQAAQPRPSESAGA